MLFHKFAPLLGPLSADLLFARSLAEQQADFPWLPHIAPAAARYRLRRHSNAASTAVAAEDIVAANRAMLATYTTGLADLIGAGPDHPASWKQHSRMNKTNKNN